MEVLWLAVFGLLNVAVPRVRGTYNISKTLTNPELVPGSRDVTIGSTVTIQCRCRNASLPITFMLFQDTSTKGRVTVSEKGEATFNVTIYNHTSLGPYKCKANSSAHPGMYSNNFTFTLQDHPTHGPGPAGETGGGWVHLAWIIPLLVLVILTAVFVFWRISTPDAKQESIQQDNTYENVSEREPETRREEEEVHYSTVILKEGNRDVTCTEQAAEYSEVTRTQPQVPQQP
ncbi:allergin-1-like isoform X2 [Lithobates pipiens]